MGVCCFVLFCLSLKFSLLRYWFAFSIFIYIETYNIFNRLIMLINFHFVYYLGIIMIMVFINLQCVMLFICNCFFFIILFNLLKLFFTINILFWFYKNATNQCSKNICLGYTTYTKQNIFFPQNYEKGSQCHT